MLSNIDTISNNYRDSDMFKDCVVLHYSTYVFTAYTGLMFTLINVS